MYKGDFLSGTGDLLSIETERNYYRTLFLRGVERFGASVCLTLEQFEEAILWCEKIIKVDSSWEEAYRLLMYCHYKKTIVLLRLNTTNIAVQY